MHFLVRLEDCIRDKLTRLATNGKIVIGFAGGKRENTDAECPLKLAVF
jgi:hypothetical protein